MRSTQLCTAAALAFALALIGCDKVRPLPAELARGCTGCHGGEENSSGAPPFSLPRNSAGELMASGNRYDHTANTVRIEVGAHTRHLLAGVSCGSCHVVPAQFNSPGHNTGNRATVVFKEMAAAGNVVPSAWVPAVHTCTNYCHGSSLNHGGTGHAPDWLGGPAAAACGTCHFAAGVTPPAAHPQGPGTNGVFADTKACATCHPETVNATDGTINVAGGKHVNGQLDGGGGHLPGWANPAQHGPAANSNLQNCTACHGTDFAGGSSLVSCTACHATNGHANWRTECTFCHGSATRTADITFPNVGSGTVVRANLASPPVGTQGENTITAYAVGAHDAHVGGGTFAHPAQCSECHGPSLPADTAHVNGQIVLGWGVTASNGFAPTPVAAGNYPRWSDTTGVVPTCANFCHGATLAGGTNTTPKWNQGAPGATCGSCHAIPLPYTAAGKWHVQRQDCVACHPGYTSTTVNLTDHIFVGAGPSGLNCHSCHGSATNDAPPTDLAGATTGGNAIGAHQAHLVGSAGTPRWRSAAVACTECHPDNAGNYRHANGSVNISWGAVASANSTYAVTPASGGFPPGGAFPTCTIYCHNPRPTDTAATNKAPSWTGAPTTVVCGSCHGLPPVGTGHTTSTACSTCHDGYANAPTSASTASAVSLTNHINGLVNVASMSCTSCHGTAGRTLTGADPFLAYAPPVAYTATNAVGAHLAHVFQGDTATPGALSSPLFCVNCHTGMLYTSAPHTYPANPVAFGSLAVAAGAAPGAYVQTTQTCASTYCHGQFSGGKTGTSITWGAAGKLACNACHGQSVAAPQPTYPHPQNTTCASCHTGYTVATVAAATHVDGLITKSTSGCTACHGDRSDTAVTLTTNTVKAAPGAGAAATSADTTGATASTVAGVGAHVAHLVGSTGTPRWRTAALACTECHALPASNTDTGHATGTGTGGARATVTWGTLAASAALGARTPTYTQPTCASTYCHSPRADTVAGLNQTPTWTGATTTVVCGSCHGLPPVANGHTASTACAGCHDGYANAPTAASTSTAVSMANHLNGVVNVASLSCTSCHGTAGRVSVAGADALQPVAPPAFTTSALAVGAHLAHVNQGATGTPLSGPFTCVNCHTGMIYTAAPHATPANPVAFGNLAVAASAAPSAYVQTTQTCASTYCHGQFSGGKTGTSITWATAGKLACNACHGQSVAAPQPTYPHPQNTACASCHAGYSTTTVAAATHVDGLITKSTGGCTACHGDRSDTAVTLTTNTVKAAPGAGAAATSADTTGATASTVAGVGAHLAHLTGTTFRAALACTDCHALPPSNTDTGHATGTGTGGARATLTWSALASDAGFEVKTPSYTQPTCTSTYCHNPKSTDTAATNKAPSWIAPGTVTCGTCHGLPPVTAAHSANAACSQCHPGYPDSPTAATVLPAAAKLIHINGQLDGGESSGATPCLNCHKTDATTGAAYGKMVSDTTVYHHVVAESTTFKTYPTTATGQACLQCHADHDVFNPALNAANTLGRGGNLRTTIATAPTKVAPASGNYTNTDFSGTAGICLSCHSASLTKSTSQLSTAVNTGAATMVVNGATFGASGHAYAVAGSITTGGSAISAVCMKCHSDPPGAAYPEKQSGTYKFALHTNTDKRLRNPMGITPSVDDLEEKFCFRCHSNSTDALSGVYGPPKTVANSDYFGAATMTVASQNLYRTFTDATHVTAMHNVIGYSGKHQPIETGAYIAANRHVECEDCHNPHAAKAGAKPASNSNLVWGPLTGVSGVNIATWPAAWTSTTAASYTVLAASTTEWQICFSCHSANNASIATWSGTSGSLMTDLALEFNPANKSRHPVVNALSAAGSGTTSLVAAQLVTPWAPGNVMTCSDCHGADSAAPATQGPHGSAVRFLLRGANRAWPYTVAGATSGTLFKISNTETNLGNANGNGLFCRNCHPQMNSAGSNAIHRLSDLTGGQHGGSSGNVPACVGCHIRVPHGGKVSRLIVTTNAPARYKVGTANMAGFTKTTKDAYTVNANIKSSCGQHSGAPAGEAW